MERDPFDAELDNLDGSMDPEFRLLGDRQGEYI